MLIALNSPLLWFLWVKAQATQNAPDIGLVKMHTVQSLYECTNTLESPKLCSKSVLGGVLQKRGAHGGQMLGIK